MQSLFVQQVCIDGCGILLFITDVYSELLLATDRYVGYQTWEQSAGKQLVDEPNVLERS